MFRSGYEPQKEKLDIYEITLKILNRDTGFYKCICKFGCYWGVQERLP